MTYIELLNSFWDSTRFNPCSSNETAMYLYLLHQCNIRRWINPFEFKTRNLEIMLGLSRNSIGAIRNTLKQRGLIDFSKGVGSGSAAYFICGAKVTNEELFEKICVKLEDTMVNTILNTKVNTTLNTKVNTKADSTLYREEKRNKTKDKSLSVRVRARERTPTNDSLFSERELDKATPKGIKASQLSEFSPPTLQEVKDSFLAQRADIRFPDWESEAISFFSYYDSQGWIKSNGRKVASWESLVTDWIMRKERESKKSMNNEQSTANRRVSPEETLAAEQSKLADRIISRRTRQTSKGSAEGDKYL